MAKCWWKSSCIGKPYSKQFATLWFKLGVAQVFERAPPKHIGWSVQQISCTSTAHSPHTNKFIRSLRISSCVQSFNDSREDKEKAWLGHGFPRFTLSRATQKKLLTPHINHLVHLYNNIHTYIHICIYIYVYIYMCVYILYTYSTYSIHMYICIATPYCVLSCLVGYDQQMKHPWTTYVVSSSSERMR